MNWRLASTLIFCASLAAEPLDVAFVLETTLGTEDAIAFIQPRAFYEDDRVAVIGVNSTVQVMQPLSDDMDGLSKAIQRAGIRYGGTVGTMSPPKLPVRLADGIERAKEELGSPVAKRKRAIIVLFAGDDPGLPRRYAALTTLARAAQIRVYAVLVQQRSPANASNRQRLEMSSAPVATTDALKHLANDSGGQLFTGSWDLKKILEVARR